MASNKVSVVMISVFLSFSFLMKASPIYAYSNPAAVDLLTVTNFAALAKSAITNPVAGTVLNNGDMGLDSPATCTGFPSPCTGITTNGTINNGTIQYQNAVALQGQTDATAVVTNLNGRTADQTIAGGVLDGLTLQQGVYDIGAAATNLAGDLTLNGDANSIFIFRASSDFITAGTGRILFTGGAQACNVYWTIASQATFDGTTSFAGTVFAGTSIDFTGGGATLNGRALAQTAAITFRNTTVNKPTCAAAATTSSSSSSSSSTVTTNSAAPDNTCIADPITTVPTIIETRRVSPTSIYLRWGPYAGLDMFNIRYGITNGEWLYNYDFTGFSTTITDLAPYQPYWFQVAARNNCFIGTYGEARLIGEPGLPNTGNDPDSNNYLWYLSVGIIVLAALVIKRTYKSS